MKGELDATQEENTKLKDQLKQSNFGFDSVKDRGCSFILFFYWFTVIVGFHVAFIL